MNNRLIDFSDTSQVLQVKAAPGCPRHDKPDPCAKHMCKHGKCRALEGMSYECECKRGYGAPMCDQGILDIAPSSDIYTTKGPQSLGKIIKKLIDRSIANCGVLVFWVCFNFI